jgi:hypothetical protein
MTPPFQIFEAGKNGSPPSPAATRGGAMVDPDQLHEVRIGSCGCVLPTDALPVGFRFVTTITGDKRVLVYACPEHDRTRPREAAAKATRKR